MEVIGDGQAMHSDADLVERDEYWAGQIVLLQATPGPNSMFQSWWAPAGTLGDIYDPVTTFIMPDEDVTITARFLPLSAYDENHFTAEALCETRQGFVGITVDTWNIAGVPDGTALDFYFYAIHQPDRFTVFYGGQVVFASGWVSNDPDYYIGNSLYVEGVQNHYWHPNVEASDWQTNPNGGLYPGILTKEAGNDLVVIRTEGVEATTVWFYKLCTQ